LGNICIATITSNTTEILKSSTEIIGTGLQFSDSNKALGGVTYDASNRCFYVAKEADPMAVYRVSGMPSNVHVDTVFDAEEVFAGKCDDLSDLWYDSETGHLFVLSDESKRVVECTLDGQVVDTLSVPGAQPEGITLSNDRRALYLTGEPNQFARLQLQPVSSVGPEGTSVVVPISLSWPWTNTVSVDYVVQSTNATAGADFEPVTGRVTFVAGATTANVEIVILEDTDTEGDESIALVLTNAESAVVGRDDRYLLDIAANTSLTLVVRSAFGGALPPVGTNFLNAGTWVSCAVTNSPLFAGQQATQYTCTGWAGSGSTPSEGAGTTTPSYLVVANSQIHLNWPTNVHLIFATSGSGTVDRTTGWYRLASAVTAQAQPAAYHDFGEWSGDVAGLVTTSPVIDFTAAQPRALTASFAERLATNGTPHWWLASFYGVSTNFDALALSDSDGDFAAAWSEFLAGTRPTDPASFLGITRIAADAGAMLLQWPSATGRVYSLYRSTGMANGWGPDAVTSGIPAAPSSTNVLILPETNRAAWYRVRAYWPARE
ncbi:MAG: hypothetical protein E4H28_07860, partial [Gemmatimonadales bacterium]